MPTTFLSLQGQVQRLAKVSTRESELVQLVKDAVNVAAFDVAREHRWSELLKLRHQIALVGFNKDTPVALPADFMVEERVKYHINEVFDPPEWRLWPRTGIVPPPLVPLKPSAYSIGGSTAGAHVLFLEPFFHVDPDNDLVYLDYYRRPPLLVNDTDQLYSNHWDSEIVKRAAHYIYTYQNKIEAATSMWRSILNPQPPQQAE